MKAITDNFQREMEEPDRKWIPGISNPITSEKSGQHELFIELFHAYEEWQIKGSLRTFNEFVKSQQSKFHITRR